MSFIYREWSYTPEQAVLIKAGDMDARNRFYEDNLERISGMACGYAARMRLLRVPRKYEPDDLIQQVWLDLPLFDYRAFRNLTVDVRRSFFWSYWGGWSYLSETHNKLWSPEYRGTALLLVDEPSKGGGGETVIDFLRSDQSAEAAYFADGGETDAILLKMVLSRFFSPRQMDVLGLYIDGYRGHGCAEKMGVKYSVVYGYLNAVKDKFIKHYAGILVVLSGIGFPVSDLSALGLPKGRSAYAVEAQRRRCRLYREKHWGEELARNKGYRQKRAEIKAAKKAAVSVPPCTDGIEGINLDELFKPVNF
jgi:hypothetical protein